MNLYLSGIFVITPDDGIPICVYTLQFCVMNFADQRKEDINDQNSEGIVARGEEKADWIKIDILVFKVLLEYADL